ncbi:hypothetical protein CDO25_11330 [Sinorhizobium meliloti]|nr:hypothetical protein CDO25_11330 [Sinorhizobium meliloti]
MGPGRKFCDRVPILSMEVDCMLSGELLIGGATRRGINGEIWGTEAQQAIVWTRVLVATLEDLEEACSLADAAFDTFERPH